MCGFLFILLWFFPTGLILKYSIIFYWNYYGFSIEIGSLFFSFPTIEVTFWISTIQFYGNLKAAHWKITTEISIEINIWNINLTVEAIISLQKTHSMDEWKTNRRWRIFSMYAKKQLVVFICLQPREIHALFLSAFVIKIRTCNMFYLSCGNSLFYRKGNFHKTNKKWCKYIKSTIKSTSCLVFRS